MNKLLLMSGSIACAKSTGLISAWVKSGHQVKVVATPSVEQFVGHATLEGLSGHPVLADTFGKGEMMSHINISRWADVIVVCPATANVINKMATGLADDMLTTTWIAAYDLKKPMIVVPVMNTAMWQYPATVSSVETLKQWGVHVINPDQGDLACGEYGAGRMPEVDDLLLRIKAIL
jgi:phosphopantothenoylcysteine decarboxylase/phosphopantothenate--cysteine ligase